MIAKSTDRGLVNTIIWYTLHPMARNTSFSLGDHFGDFVEAEVATGRYGSASEVVRAGLRLLEDREAQIAALRAALIEGEESGPALPFNIEAFLAAKRGAADAAG
jgi:antitoxin ParD1/3/4